MPRLDISFLGTFQVSLDRQPITHFRSTNNQGLLAYLALQSEKPLAREVLTAVFWPEESDENARNNLRQSLYQLRKLLGDLDEPEQPYLLVTRQTVQFNPKSDYTLDANLFLEAIEAHDLATAVTLYHDDLLPGFTCDSLEFEAWLRQEREMLHQLALETMVELTRDHLRNGRLDKAQLTARQQLSLEPWREQAHRQLMQAYALAGDRGNALAQYAACRETLAEELGVEPAGETAVLFEDIKSGRLGPIVSEEALRPPVKVRHNLPAATTPLIGRELERGQINQLFSQGRQRLVTIVGPGGMGKTRLALAVGLEVLDQFSDGIYFVDLAPLVRPDEIPQAVAAALDYQAPDKSQALFPQLLKAIRQQDLLLILDNFEHLLAGAPLVNEMLQTCPQLTILVTSRQRLNLASESRFELGGLNFPDWLTPEDALDYTAVQLFVDNDRRLRPEFELDEENVTAVARICQLVQGMPLGLVLAAAWLELLTPAEIAAEIESSLDFLAADLADLPPRQRSMQAVFDRSWQLMTPAEQTALAKLSIFRGGFTREAAEQVAGTNLRILLALVNKSLLQRRPETGRFTMHELLRQFAAAQRRKDDPHEQVDRAHGRYFAGLVRAEVRRTLFFYPLLMPRQHGADRDNLRRAWNHALTHGLVELLPDLTRGMVFYTLMQGIQPLAISEQAIRALQIRGVPDTDKTMLTLRLVGLAARMGIEDIRVLEGQFLPLASLVEENGDPELRFWTYERGMTIYNDPGNPRSLDWAAKAYQAAQEMEDDLLAGMIEVIRLWSSGYLGLQDAAAPADLLAMLPTFEQYHPDSLATYGILVSLSAHSAVNGEYEQAIQYGRRGLNIAKRWQDLLWISQIIDQLAHIYVRMGLLHEAGTQQLDALEWHLAIGQRWQMLGYLWSLVVSLPQLVGGRETAVAILAMVYHHPEVTPHYQQKIEEALPRFEAEMGAAAFASAWEHGKGLDFDTAVSQVRLALASAG